jgi:hypothetical protein
MLGEKKYMPILDPEKEVPMCSKCIYAFPERRTREYPAGYTCWRYPPKDQVNNGKVLTYAPAVAGEHSCGEGMWFVEGGLEFILSYLDVSALIFNRKEK